MPPQNSALLALTNSKEESGTAIVAQTHVLNVSLSSSLSHLWDLLLWLCLTFRQPEAGKICLSTSKIDGDAVTLQALTPAEFPEHTTCWFGLFEKAIIAMDPRIQSSSQILLDADFHLMVRLAAVEYPVMVDRGFILMGYSTALIPVKEVDHQTILWHLEIANHDFQFKTHRTFGNKRCLDEEDKS
jgi:hypothetical protein